MGGWWWWVGQAITNPISGPSLSFVFCLLALSLTICVVTVRMLSKQCVVCGTTQTITISRYSSNVNVNDGISSFGFLAAILCPKTTKMTSSRSTMALQTQRVFKLNLIPFLQKSTDSLDAIGLTPCKCREIFQLLLSLFFNLNRLPWP